MAQRRGSCIFPGFLLWGMLALLPAGKLLLPRFGYVLEMNSVFLYALLTALLALCLAFRGGPGADSNRAAFVPAALLAPLSLLWGLFCLAADARIPVILCLLAGIGACFVLTGKCGGPKVLKTVSFLAAGLLVVPVAVLCLLVLTFGGLSQETIVRTEASPGGTWYAQVIERDEGALGGDTVVEVRPQREWNAGLIRIAGEPRRVYTGDWGESGTMEIHWEDEHTLRIDSSLYKVDGPGLSGP